MCRLRGCDLWRVRAEQCELWWTYPQRWRYTLWGNLYGCQKDSNKIQSWEKILENEIWVTLALLRLIKQSCFSRAYLSALGSGSGDLDNTDQKQSRLKIANSIGANSQWIRFLNVSMEKQPLLSVNIFDHYEFFLSSNKVRGSGSVWSLGCLSDSLQWLLIPQLLISAFYLFWIGKS